MSAGLGKVSVKMFQGAPADIEEQINAWLDVTDLSRVGNFNFHTDVAEDGRITVIYTLVVPPGAGTIQRVAPQVGIERAK